MLQEYLDQLLTLQRGIQTSDGRTVVHLNRRHAEITASPAKRCWGIPDGVRQARQARRGAEPGGHTGRSPPRACRAVYPTYDFNGYYFELDNEGNPYYICPVLKPNAGLAPDERNFEGESCL